MSQQLAARKRILIILLFAGVAALVLSPIASNKNIPANVDFLNHFAGIIQAKFALLGGQFPLRIALREHGIASYPLFQFYSPTSYMVSGWIYHWLPHANPFIAYKITLLFALMVGGTYMYRCAYWFVKSTRAALLASVAYLLAPYYIMLVDNLGGFNEAIALGILPVVWYYALQLYYFPTIKVLLQSSIAWYLLITIHLLTFISTAAFIFSLLMLITFQKTNRFKNLCGMGLGFAYGCLLAIWFLGPAVLLGKYLIINHTFNHISNYIPPLSYLLAPIASSSSGAVLENGIKSALSQVHPALGFPLLIASGLCAYAFFAKKSIDVKTADNLLLPLLVMFCIAFFLIWSPYNFWTELPSSFSVLQYTWRLLSQIMWLGSMLLAWSICWVFGNKINNRISVFLGIGIIIASSSWLLLPINKFYDVSIAKLNKVHSLVNSLFPSDAYLLDTEKYPQFIDMVDNITLNAAVSSDKDFVFSTKPMVISPQLIFPGAQPSILLKGEFQTPLEINVLLNDKSIGQQKLTGKFFWKIPLDVNHAAAPFAIQFKKIGSIANLGNHIPLVNIVIGDLMNSTRVLSLEQVIPHCHQEGMSTICGLNVPTATRLVELPVFYYPGLLQVTLNERRIPYISVLNDRKVVVGIAPNPGELNNIKVQFNGFLWANFLSSAAWQLWLLLLAFITLRRFFYN